MFIMNWSTAALACWSVVMPVSENPLPFFISTLTSALVSWIRRAGVEGFWAAVASTMSAKDGPGLCINAPFSTDRWVLAQAGHSGVLT